jgi:hypothetical protein
MPNPLTGDFEAVLQVSGSTVNRLLASMHQNAFTDTERPSFPHSVRMRLGDDHAFEGVRGVVHAQVSVPRVTLLHGVTDRIQLEVGVRAWYRPDPGTTPMATFIHGTVHAEYRLRDIPASCLGYAHDHAGLLWVRVVRDSVRFLGTAEDDESLSGMVAVGAGPDPAARVSQVTRQIARLLARRFQAAPHPVEKRFRRGAMRSLNAPIGGAAVAVPLDLSGGSSGQIASVDNVILGGRDVAVGVSIDHIMTLVGSMLEPIKNFKATIPVPELDTVYHVGVHPPTVTWTPHGSHAVLEITLSGWANTNAIWPNASVTLAQKITLSFDGSFQLSPWSPGISVTATGVGSGLVAAGVKQAIKQTVPSIVKNVCDSVQKKLDGMTAQTNQLTTQLRTLDAQASVYLDDAEFVQDGVVLRGTIDLSPRRAIVVKQELTAAGDAHSALESWIPGGRVDRLDWTWTWFGAGEPGQATFSDRFLLRRPWQSTSRWGLAVGLRSELPGLDGWGRVCLRITGARLDPVTGQMVTVTSRQECIRFGYDMRLRSKGGRLFLRDMPELSKDVPFPQLEERPLIAVREGQSGARAANTLLIYVDRAWESETAHTLGGALESCRRYDAGLGVLVLFRSGLLEADGGRVIGSIERHARKLGIAAHVNEDVHGNWARALELGPGSGESGWAIITPDGRAAWTHRGAIGAADLAVALDAHLDRAPDLRPVPYRPPVEPGARLGAVVAHHDYGDLIDQLEPDCPPVPLFLPGVNKAVFTFVQRRGGGSSAHLRRLVAQVTPLDDDPAPGRPPALVVVVDGADPQQADTLRRELGLDVVAIPDPQGQITDRFGVDVWPTTITVDRRGVVTEVQVGQSARRGAAVDPEREERPPELPPDRTAV